ncbi:polysaccharide biosynthesis protein, partial [Chlorogloeopsis sp. ULAP02]
EGEEYEPTEHEKLLIVKNASRIIPDNLTISVEDLCKAAAKNHTNLILFLLEQMVPGYKPKYLESNVLVDTVANNNLLVGTNGNIIVRVKPGSV